MKNKEKFYKKKNALVYSNIINHTEWNGYGFQLENKKKLTPIPVKEKLIIWDYDIKKNEIK